MTKNKTNPSPVAESQLIPIHPVPAREGAAVIRSMEGKLVALLGRDKADLALQRAKTLEPLPMAKVRCCYTAVLLY